MSWPHPPKAPWWFTLLTIFVAIAAAFVFPEASRVLDSASWLGGEYVAWLYPLYIIFTAVLAWICYPARRPLAWILVGLMALSSIGLFAATIVHNPV